MRRRGAGQVRSRPQGILDSDKGLGFRVIGIMEKEHGNYYNGVVQGLGFISLEKNMETTI